MESQSNEMQADSTKEPVKFGVPESSDVVLVVEDQEFHVHKMALASRSKYFNALFYCNFKEMSQDRIEIKDVGAVPFRRLLEFMYYGKILDDHPCFIANRVITNKGFGELKTEHNAIDDQKMYIRDFWKASSEVLEAADRFDVKKDFYNYFVTMLENNICTTPSCFVCVTIHIFALVNDLKITTLESKKHDSKFIKEWLQLAKEAKIKQDDRFDLVAKSFNSLG